MKVGTKKVIAKKKVTIAAYIRASPVARQGGCAGNPALGFQWCVISVGGGEIWTRPSLSLAFVDGPTW
jgi:hypothetical protein